MKYLHVAVLEDYEECLVSGSVKGLRDQILESLGERSIIAPTDEEWLVCISAEAEWDIETENPILGGISYYKVQSKI